MDRVGVAIRSGHLMIVSEIERSQIRHKRPLVFETTQIQDLRAVIDSSNNRNGEAAKRSSKACKCTTRAAFRARPDREAGAWHCFKRQRAGANLARASNGLERASAAKLRRNDRQQPVCHGFYRR